MHSRTQRTFAVGLVCLAAATVVGTEEAAALDAAELLRRADSHINFPDAEMTMKMSVFKKDREQKSYVMKLQKRDSDGVRIEFLEPKREKGRKILRTGNKMYMFLPDLGKSIVISARQSFLGSNFSNGDLLSTDLVRDYDPEILRSETIDGQPATVLGLKAKSRKVEYDRIELWVNANTFIPIKEEFYTRSGKMIKVLEFSEPATLGGVELATVMTVGSPLVKNEVTILTIESLAVEKDLPPSLFVKESLAHL